MLSYSTRGKGAAGAHDRLQQQKKQSSPTYVLGGSPQLRMKVGLDPVNSARLSDGDDTEKIQDGIQVAQPQEGAVKVCVDCDPSQIHGIDAATLCRAPVGTASVFPSQRHRARISGTPVCTAMR